MKLFVTCIAWVESVLNKEIERLNYNILKTSDRYVYCETDEAWIARVNMWSRVWNKVHLELNKWTVNDFDDLFELITEIDWKDYIDKSNPILVSAVSIKSSLDSLPAIQKTAKKAIVTQLSGSKSAFVFEDEKAQWREILIFIEDNDCRILLNTSWEALHKRWYRTSEHEAPIKESLWAALVLLSWWSFKKPLYDFFCGSGTVVIEAALIARNIAPGCLWRKFAFEDFSQYPSWYLEEAKKEAESKAFKDKIYSINANDIDTHYIDIAKQNAKKAWVLDTINFEVKDFSAYRWAKNLDGTLVSNPPYWLRLNVFNLNWIYRDLAYIFNNNSELKWWFITSYFEFDNLVNLDNWKKRKLYNWNEKCYFYKKI